MWPYHVIDSPQVTGPHVGNRRSVKSITIVDYSYTISKHNAETLPPVIQCTSHSTQSNVSLQPVVKLLCKIRWILGCNMLQSVYRCRSGTICKTVLAGVRKSEVMGKAGGFGLFWLSDFLAKVKPLQLLQSCCRFTNANTN